MRRFIYWLSLTLGIVAAVLIVWAQVLLVQWYLGK